MNRFAEILDQKSDLNITVKTYPNSVLGGSNDMLSGMPTGLTDLFYNTLSCYPWLEGAQKFNAVTAPFLWDSQEEFQAFLDSETAQQGLRRRRRPQEFGSWQRGESCLPGN